ncbi:MAG: HrpJ domain-containing protein [Chlamydiota bacterium]
MSDPHISPSVPVSPQAVKMIQQEATSEIAMQVESDEDLNQYFELSLFNPMTQAQRFRDLKDVRLSHKLEETASAEEGKVLEVEKIDEVASRFQRNNYELNARTLMILHGQIARSDTPEQILDKVRAIYADPSLADEALDFLIETTVDPEMQAKIREAKEILNAAQGREIKAGRNMGAQAREFSQEGLGSPTSLRDLYRDITGTAREPLKLFDELSEKFRYPKLKSVITFLLHSLGQDLKSKGPSIARGELKRLLDETRSLQGILGVFRFFQSRMRLISREFTSYSLTMPQKLDFELLARTFIKMLAERYMNPEKIMQTAKLLGVSEEVAAQIIIYTQMRDALKQIAPRYYRNPQHRDELLKAFIDALEKLEDELEEEEDDEDEEKK